MFDQAAERFVYQFFARLDIIEDRLFENEETTIDPHIRGLYRLDTLDEAIIQCSDYMKRLRWLDR